MKIKLPGKLVESPDGVKTYKISAKRSSLNKQVNEELTADDMTEFQFDDNTVWLAQTDEVPAIFNKKPSRSSNEVFQIPAYIEVPTEKRGAVKKIFLKLVKIFKPEKVLTAMAARKLAAKMEATILTEGLKTITADFEVYPVSPSQVDKLINPDKPLLLLIHGTSSSTFGSFGGLSNSESWAKMQAEYGDNILTYEHRTWSKSPLENALDVLKLLPSNLDLHLLSHSRGGLVGDVLCRVSHPDTCFTKLEMDLLKKLDRKEDIKNIKALNKTASKKNIKVGRFVRVACPAAGTTLLSKRLDHFLNFILNVVDYGLGQKLNPIVEALKILLTSLIEQRYDPGVLPGLEAMVPGTPIQKIINNPQIKINSELCIISGNAGVAAVKKTLKYLMARLYYFTDNDFVVDTDSMYMGAVRDNKIFYKFVKGKTIDHFTYFLEEEVQRSIFLAFTESDLGRLPDFKLVIRDEKNRNVTSLIPGGEVYPTIPLGDKPLLVLIPGTMGSNLYDGDNEIWLSFPRLIKGDLERLDINNKNVNAKSLMASAYGKFEEYFNDYFDVIVFPYDWRKSLETEGKRLANKLKELQSIGQPIQIIAHSMGGLMVRDVMMNHPNLWKELSRNKQFKAVMMGTPWTGSYGVSRTVTGKGKTINSLSSLSFFQTKQELLQIFVQYPGLMELLPLYGHTFEDIDTWKALELTTRSGTWQVPAEAELERFKNYKNKLLKHKFELDNVVYVAGKADKTPEGFVFRDQYGYEFSHHDSGQILEQLNPSGSFVNRHFELVYQGVGDGDGSVTWASGVPKDLPASNLYYMSDTGHGELLNNDKHFEAIKEILQNGSTRRLGQTLPVSRANVKPVDMPEETITSNQPDELARSIIGLDTQSLYDDKETTAEQALKITVKNGHLQYAKFPIMAGHFKGDGIVSAEAVIDFLLKKKLREREQIGLYPGAIGSNLVILPEHDRDLGAVIVGLGYPEDLTPFLLSYTVEQACLEYALSKRNSDPNTNDKSIGISTLLVGSGYANLALSNAINAILEGVINANNKIDFLDNDLPFITEVEFIELYRDKCMNAFFILNEIVNFTQLHNLQLEHPIKMVEGSRTYIPLADEKEWWKRISANMLRDEEQCEDYIFYSASTGRARVEERRIHINLAILDALLEDNSTLDNWSRELMKPVFEILIPNEFKNAFRNQQNILLILNKNSAAIPWELLHYDDKAGMPVCVSAGMIRQLSTSDDRLIIKPVKVKSALVIGDPLLANSDIPQLPEAEKEAIAVNEILLKNGFETTPRIRSTFKEIFTKLYNEYKIIHIASHGVIDYGDDGKSGILLSDDIVLTAAEINQISSTPELVFVNSCYMGKVDPAKEKNFRQKYKLAANIGTQLIENGVKAVVVAGWAVDDAAAGRFSEVFYEKMLSGHNFAEAVKAARSSCYHEFPYTNTWGAYQCYGDQYYKLVTVRKAKSEDQGYILDKEILIDLENFINQTKDARTRVSHSIKRLSDISDKIDASGLRNSKILEQEARAYEQIEEYETALDKYEELFKQKKSDYSVRSFEVWNNINARYLVRAKKRGDSQNTLNREMNKVIRRLKELIKMGETSERYALLGSCYKRQSLVVSNEEQRLKALGFMADAYFDALFLNNDNLEKIKIYPLANWLIAAKLLDNPEYLDWVNERLGINIESFLNDLEEQIKKKFNEREDFWDGIELVNIYQCKLLFCKAKKEIAEIEDEIKEAYTKAWQIGGSHRQKSSEEEQMEFIRDTLKAVNPQERLQVSAFDSLLSFFDSIE